MTSQVTAVPRVVRDQLMTDNVFDRHVVPYLSNPHSKPDHHNVERLEDETALIIFTEANKIAELYNALASLSGCNRYYRGRLQPKKQELAERIISILFPYQQTPEGSETMTSLIATARYLNVFKIYFYYKPEALHFCYKSGKKPLDIAVEPAHDMFRSLSFVALILERDKLLVQNGRKSLLLIPDSGGDMVCKRLLREEQYVDEWRNRKREPGMCIYWRFGPPSFENGVHVKTMLFKHAKDLGIVKDAFGKEESEVVKTEKTVAKPTVATETNKESTTKVDKPKTQLIPEKKKLSFCSSLYKAFMYVVTCQWVFDLIKMFKNRK